MKNIKKLSEQRAALKAEGKKITELSMKDGVEIREMSEDEISQAEEIRSQIEDIDSQIEEEKRSRSSESKVETRDFNNEEKENKMASKEEEVRALNLYVKGQTQSEEYRDLSDTVTLGNNTAGTPGNGGVTVPTTVRGELIDKVGETSPVFALVQKVTSNNGFYRFPRKTSSNMAGFANELDNLKKLTPTLEYVDLGQKRVGAYTQISDMILNDSAIDVIGEALKDLSSDLGAALEKSILIGKGGAEFSGVVGNVDAKNVLTYANAEAPTVEEIIDTINGLNPFYLSGSVFVVSREVFNNISKLKDGDGEYLYFRGDTTTHNQPTFGGFPVYVTDQLAGQDTQLVFGNFSKGYGMVIKDDIMLRTVDNDTQSVLAGVKLLAITAYMDGAVVDPFAFVTTKKA